MATTESVRRHTGQPRGRSPLAWLAILGFVVLAARCGTGGGSLTVGARTLLDLSPVERAALRDKVISDPELDGAVGLQRRCLAAVPGLTAVRVDRTGSGVTAEWRVEGGTDDETEAATDACSEEVHAIVAVARLQRGSWSDVTEPGLEEALHALDLSD